MADELNQNVDMETSEKNGFIASEPPQVVNPRPLKKGLKRSGFVFFVLSILTFGAFLFFTIPFLQIFFNQNAKDLGEALGKVFGLMFTIVFMVLTGIPHLIFSLVSTILFGTAIGKTDKPDKTKAIIFFAISLFLLVAAVAIAGISFIVIKRA